MPTVRVTTPIAATNLGPGLDRIALATGLYTTVVVSDAQSGLSITSSFPGHSPDQSQMVDRLFRETLSPLFRKVGFAISGLTVSISIDCPPTMLGARESIIIASSIASNILIGAPLEKSTLQELAFTLTDSPSLIIASIQGRLAIANQSETKTTFASLPTEPMNLFLVGLLPPPSTIPSGQKTIPLEDAHFNIGQTGLLVHALQTSDYNLLSNALEDRIAQAALRESSSLWKSLSQPALDAGAAALTIADNTGTLLIFAPDGHDEIEESLKHTWKQKDDQELKTWSVPIDTQGIRISEMGSRIASPPIPATDLPVAWPFIPRTERNPQPSNA